MRPTTLLLLLALAGCGGDNVTTEQEGYAKGLCEAGNAQGCEDVQALAYKRAHPKISPLARALLLPVAAIGMAMEGPRYTTVCTSDTYTTTCTSN
jgi:hypothetical protein